MVVRFEKIALSFFNHKTLKFIKLWNLKQFTDK